MAELTSEGLRAPAVMVREGNYKLILCESDPPLLFDLAADPDEQVNCSGNRDLADIEARLRALIDETWDFDDLSRRVVADQRRRRIVDRAHALGQSVSWDYTVPAPGNKQYLRPCPANPGASNYNESFEVRARPDSEKANAGGGPADSETWKDQCNS